MTRLSICLIVGDVQVGVLPRVLWSILERPEGSAADEVVIDWNGQDDKTFSEAISQFGGRLSETTVGVRGVHFNIARGPNPREVGFDVARNLNFARATGVWRMYVDADDILAGAEHTAFKDSLEQEPPKEALEAFPVKGTLPEFVMRLPEHVTVVLAPYNYLNSEKGRPLTRKRRPRIVKWDRYWTWINGVHEILRHVLDREVPVWAPGILLVHQPVEAVMDRVERNAEILTREVQRLNDERQDPGPSVLYSIGAHAMAAEQFDVAMLRFKEAADHAPNAEDRLLYHLAAHRCAIELGDYTRAGKFAIDAINPSPERPEGYFAAAEAAFGMKKYEYCIRWYEAGKDKKVPSVAMLDDRIDRCLRPVRHAGAAYLRMQHYASALEVAEKAIKESAEPFALRVKALAEEGLARQKVSETATAFAESLGRAGFPRRALDVINVASDVLGIAADFRAVKRAMTEKIAANVVMIPPASNAAAFLADRDFGDVSIEVPLDAVDGSLTETLALAAKDVPDGKSLRVATTDPQSGDPYALATRVDAIPAPKLLSALDVLGDVEDLAFVEDAVDDSGNSTRFVVAKTVVRKKASWTPDITIFAPVFAEPWGPWRILKDGTGGSEESVIYLAREFADRGLNVEVFAPLDNGRHRGVHVEGRVRWFPLDSFDPTKPIPGISIACRAPWALRYQAFTPERTYVWHQDAEYSMGWTPAVARAVRHLWVSKWQRAELLKAVGMKPADPSALFDDTGVVCGDAIPRSAVDTRFPLSRDPFSVVYTSSPLRGLVSLLDIWPMIRASFPDANLSVFYGWATAPGQTAGYQTYVMDRVRQAKGVEWVGRVPQRELEEILVNKSIWAYPAGATGFPEGYCIAGVRAAAAGLLPVYRRHAAMGETQYPSPWSCPDTTWEEGGAKDFTEALLGAMQAAKDGVDRKPFRAWADGKTWDRVADAILSDIARNQGVKEEKRA